MRVRKFDSIALALFYTVLQVLMFSIGLLCGIPCNPLYCWISVAVVLTLAYANSRRTFLTLAAMIAGSLLLCSFTFSYTGSDASSCHAPMQRLLINGWNPIFQSGLEELKALLANYGTGFKPEHMLYAPKFTVYSAAIVAKGCGLWIADSFLGWILLMVLLMAGRKFFYAYFGNSLYMAVLFSVGLASTPMMIWMMGGFVDFTIYAAMALSLVMGLLWLKSGELTDCVSFTLAGAICTISKATGLGYMLVIVLFMLCCTTNRRVTLGWSAAAMVALFCIIAVSPVFTAWVGGECSLDGLTSDFGGNDHFMRMGYLARICYAWFSSRLTVFACSVLYGIPDFNPIYNVAVAGKSSVWTLFFMMSIAALLLSKKNVITAACVVLFVTSNLAPLKYIGYVRYCPQIGLIPLLAFANFCSNPVDWPFLRHLGKWLFAGYALYILPTLGSIIIFWGVQLAEEKVRQSQLEEMRTASHDWTMSRVTGIMADRVALCGLNLTTGDSECHVSFDRNPTIFSGERILTGRDLHKNDFWMFGGIKGYLFDFDWGRWLAAFLNPPHILWDKKEGHL